MAGSPPWPWARSGDIALFLTIALCLVVDFSGAGILLAYMVLVGVSRFGLVVQSFRNFTSEFRRSDTGHMYILLGALTVLAAALSLYHREWGEFEVAAKRFIVAYVVVNLVWNYSSRFVLAAVTCGAALACGLAVFDVYVLHVAKADGSTNSIRFGMLAALFSVLALCGWLFANASRGTLFFYAAGSILGLWAAMLSGSRGALLAIPLMLVAPTVRLAMAWRPWKMIALAGYVLAAAFFLVVNTGGLRSSSESAITEIGDPSEVNEKPADRSTSIRRDLLFFALDQFRENIWLGVGSSGWDSAIREAMGDPDSPYRFRTPFNQAHNQFVNDLAKGGMLRAAFGVLLIAVPFLIFLRAHPVSDRDQTMPSLLGLVTVVGFAAFSMTESVMVLSLTASIYSVLVFYLLGAKEDRWSKPAPDRSDRL